MAAGLLLSMPVAHSQSVTVQDRLSIGQQEETIAVFFAGRLVGTLHVGPDHATDSFTAPLNAFGIVDYTLCGRLLRRDQDGSISVHPIDNSGRLRTAAGHSLSAFTQGDVLFRLQDDDTGDQGTVTPGPACSAAVS